MGKKLTFTFQYGSTYIIEIDGLYENKVPNLHSNMVLLILQKN